MAGREKNEGTRDKAFAFDFALLSQRMTLIGSSMASVKNCQNAPAAYGSSMREGIPLDALN